MEALFLECRPCRQPSTSWTLVITAGSPPLRLVKSAFTAGSNSFSAASQSFASTVSKMESTNSMISACSLMASIVGDRDVWCPICFAITRSYELILSRRHASGPF